MDETEIGPETPDEGDRPSPRLVLLRGAQSGARLMMILAGPIAAVSLVIRPFPTRSGGGPDAPPIAVLTYGPVLFGVLVALGCVVGAATGLVASLACWLGGRSGPGAWTAIADDPIRVISGRRSRADRPRPGARRWPTRWLVGSTIAILAGGLVAWGVASRRVDRRLAAAIAEADRDDPRWRLDDLLADRAPVPDAENGAIVVDRVSERLPTNWPYGPPPEPGTTRPAPTRLARAFDRIGAIGPDHRLDDETADAIAEELRERGEAVRLARTVAEFRRGRREIAPTPNPFFGGPGETDASRGVARLLAADAAILARDGDADGAIASCGAILGVGRSIGDEPSAGSMGLRSALASYAATTARRVLGQGEPSDAALAALQAALLAELARPVVAYGVRGERAMLDELYRRVRDGEIPLPEFGRDTFGDEQPGEPPNPENPWERLWLENQRATRLEWMNRLVAILRGPTAGWDGPLRSWAKEVFQGKYSPIDRLFAGVPAMSLESLAREGEIRARIEAATGSTAILLAAERHRLEHGEWPASVAAIDPAILVAPPPDPYTGRPFLVDRRDGRFLVYSVGPNLRDEHGVQDSWSSTGPNRDDPGSRAWDVNLRRKPAPAEPPAAVAAP